MPTTMPPLLGESIYVRPWPDEVVDRVGYDPRTPYVERFWLGVLGPSTVWFLRRVAAELEATPSGFELPLADTARSLGLGAAGPHSPFVRALRRCCQFDMARGDGPGTLAVRRKLPPLSRRHLARLPETVQAEHHRWVADALATADGELLRHRARKLALSLLELGEDLESTERHLQRWRFHPVLAHESAAWAWRRHQDALVAAGDPHPTAA